MRSLEIGSGLHVIVGGMFPRCNSIVILGNENIIVDPGCSIEDLRRFLHAHDLELRDIDTVILTHIHPDHILNATRLNRLSRCRIAANEITTPLFNDKEKMKRFLGFHPGHPIRSLWVEYVEEHMYGALDEGHVDEELRDGDKFACSDLTLRCLYTPGHTPDHMCIEILELNAVFAADIDCTEFGPFYGHPNSSISEFRESIQLLQHRNYDIFLSGHLRDPVVRDYKMALASYDRQFDVREDLVLASIMAGSKTVSDIVATPIVYPALSNPVFLQFERWMIEHHVNQLIDKGFVMEKDGNLRPV